jgi:hypothetical protein
MNSHFLYRLLLVFTIGMPGAATSQNLDDLFEHAHWPLLTGPEDSLGITGDIELIHSFLDPIQGAYSNGVYIGDFPDSGSYIRSPRLETLYDSVFAVRLEFWIDELDNQYKPVIVLGESYRYLGFEILDDHHFLVLFNNSGTIPINTDVIPQVYYELTMIHYDEQALTEIWLNGEPVAVVTGELDRSGTDGAILNCNPATGRTFRGYWRHLRVLGSDEATALRDDMFRQHPLTIIPNPTTTEIRIAGIDVAPCHWTIVDVEGKALLTGILNDMSDTIDISSLVAGVYHIQVTEYNAIRPVGSGTFIRMK